MNENQTINQIIKNKNIFENLKSLAFQETNEEVQLKLIEQAALWAVRNCMGEYSDIDIEKKLCYISSKYHTKQHPYKKGSFLHVATLVQSMGGHTRLIENWIINSDNDEKHSVVVTNQLAKEIPIRLKESIVQKSGDIYKINKDNYIEKALILRELASKYEYIILYTSMHDIIPILAFGTEEFRRPIILYNHADHIFWIGISITDLLIELSHDGKAFSLKNRGDIISDVLSIPVNYHLENLNKEKAIKRINRELFGKKIIISMASPYKYNSFENYNFISTAKEIIDNNPNSYFFVIGPDKSKQIEWEKVYKETGGKINAIGYKQRKEVFQYKAIADLYIDSFPFYSYTSMLEFAIYGIPILSLNTPINKIDVMYEKEVLCNNSDELVRNSKRVLQSSKRLEKYIIQKEVKKLSDQHAWKVKKDYIVDSAPKLHKLHFDFSNKSRIDSYDVFIARMQKNEGAFFPFTKEISNLLNFKILSILIINKSIDKHLMKYFIGYVKYKLSAFYDKII